MQSYGQFVFIINHSQESNVTQGQFREEDSYFEYVVFLSKWILAFIEYINAKWTAISLVQDLNFDLPILFFLQP